MAKLSEAEVREGLGLEPLEKPAPRNRVEDTLQSIDELDRKHAKMVEEHRRPGESHEQASDRLMRELPTLYPTLKREKAMILRRKGMGADAAVGGV